MKANLITKTIEMTKSEAKAAGKIGTEKFNELKEYQRAYPNYTICIVEAPKRKTDMSGLDYKFMEYYIQKCNKENKKEILDQFNTYRAAQNKGKKKGERVAAASYFTVRDWFLATFPEIQQAKDAQKKRIENITKTTSKKNADETANVA